MRLQDIAQRASALASTVTAAALLLSPMLGPASPALADDPIVRDHRGPAARLEIVIHRIHIFDDNDWGEGEISLRMVMLKLRECPESERGGLDFCRDVIAQGTINFGADSGETVTLDRTFPGPGDEVLVATGGPGIGLPMHAGPGYIFAISGVEIDTTIDDKLGSLSVDIREQNGWGPLGSYNERGQECVMKGFLHHYEKCGIPAAYSVEYEIRRTELPDLVPTAFRVAEEIPGDRDDQVCVTLLNRGPVAVGPFQASIGVNGAIPPSRDVDGFGLAPGESRERCTGLRLPETAERQATVVIDRDDAIAEMDETNNILQQTVARTQDGGAAGPLTAADGANTTSTNSNTQSSSRPQPTSSPVPVLEPTKGQLKLSVTAIQVNGQAPDGKDDCKDGKNAVTVRVKNGGDKKVDAFTVRLSVDGAQGEAVERAAGGLDAGKEREVRFEDLRLKKGDHKLTATLDQNKAVSNSDDSNNGLTVTARCSE